jgi:hypothetical protein
LFQQQRDFVDRNHAPFHATGCWMSGQLDAVEAKRHTTDLICAIFGSEFDGRMRTTGELRLAVLEWILNLEGDPAVAAKMILTRKADSHVAALPLTVIAILHEIARGDVARFERRGRRAKRRVAN